MSFSRFLVVGAIVSLVLHGFGSAFFARNPNEVSIAAFDGGGISVVGSITDLVAGAQVKEVPETIPVEAIEPEPEPVRPVAVPVEVAEVTPDTPVKSVEATRVQPVAEPVTVKTTPAAVPLVEGVTGTAPVTAVEPAGTVLQHNRSSAKTANPIKPIEAQPERTPVEIARIEPAAGSERGEPVAQKLDVQQPIEAPLAGVIQTPRIKPKPSVRKSRPTAPSEIKAKTAQKKGAETSFRKGGERITSKTARSKVNGRKNAKARDGGAKAKSNYQDKVAARLRREKRYPREARREHLEGTVRVSFTISRNGSVSGLRITRSSGHSVLDQAALDMVRRAAPMPKFPSDIGVARMTLQVPVRFDG